MTMAVFKSIDQFIGPLWFLGLGLSDTSSGSDGSSALLRRVQRCSMFMILICLTAGDVGCDHLDIVVSSQFALVVNKYIFGERYFEYICIPYTSFVLRNQEIIQTLDSGQTGPDTAGLTLAFLLSHLERPLSSKEEPGS